MTVQCTRLSWWEGASPLYREPSPLRVCIYNCTYIHMPLHTYTPVCHTYVYVILGHEWTWQKRQPRGCGRLPNHFVHCQTSSCIPPWLDKYDWYYCVPMARQAQCSDAHLWSEYMYEPRVSPTFNGSLVIWCFEIGYCSQNMQLSNISRTTSYTRGAYIGTNPL